METGDIPYCVHNTNLSTLGFGVLFLSMQKMRRPSINKRRVHLILLASLFTSVGKRLDDIKRGGSQPHFFLSLHLKIPSNLVIEKLGYVPKITVTEPREKTLQLHPFYNKKKRASGFSSPFFTWGVKGLKTWSFFNWATRFFIHFTQFFYESLVRSYGKQTSFFVFFFHFLCYRFPYLQRVHLSVQNHSLMLFLFPGKIQPIFYCALKE